MTDFAAILVGGGEVDEKTLAGLIQPHRLLVGVDGGALVFEKLGAVPAWVVGDCDSIGPHELRNLQANGARLRRYPRDKDQTDMEIALELAAESGAAAVAVFGATGTRLDHTLTNLGMLRYAAMLGVEAAIFAPGQEIRLLMPGRTTIGGAPGMALSLVPLSAVVTGVRTENLRFPLCEETLFLGRSRGVHNEFLGEEAAVAFTTGELAAFIFDPGPPA